MALSLQILAKNGQGARCRFTQNGSILSFREVLNLWQFSVEATKNYVQQIKNLGFDQCYWEHPALTQATMDFPYECMILKTEQFTRRQVDTESFSAHLHQEKSVAVFDNLGRNARLVVPTLKSDKEYYKHFGIFLNAAPENQVLAVLQAVGESVLEEVNRGKCIWLSTAGLGVIWLHIRLDTVPKYYKTKTYKSASFLSQSHNAG
ncbi:MAG: hypothetical protein R8G66_26395 [Cytophagales bacterium]|nr:hypothetical protein [Cytophagales bacterium]